MEQFRSKHKQTQSEWEAEMSKKVLEFVRSELYMDLRFLDIALGTLVYRADENIRSFATDGTYLYFSTEQVLRVFQSNPKYLDRAYLHRRGFQHHMRHCGQRRVHQPVPNRFPVCPVGCPAVTLL